MQRAKRFDPVPVLIGGTGKQRYMDGLPCFYGTEYYPGGQAIVISEANQIEGMKSDPKSPDHCDKCGIALQLKENTHPIAHVYATEAWVAWPCDDGLPLKGHRGKWGMFLLQLRVEGLRFVRNHDDKKLKGRVPEWVRLMPVRPSRRPESRIKWARKRRRLDKQGISPRQYVKSGNYTSPGARDYRGKSNQ